MASKNTAVAAKPQQAEEPKGLKAGIVTCMECMHALLHRYGMNPILSACQQKPQPHDAKFPYQVEVASCKRKCAGYEKSNIVKTVQIRVKAA